MPVLKRRTRPEPWSRQRAEAKHFWLIPVFALEWGWRWLAYLLSGWAFLEVIEYFGTLSLLVAAVSYFAESNDRIKQKHYQAWQVINSAQGKGGNGGRIDALEELHKDGVLLVGVDVSDAFLKGVDLSGANLLRANFRSADIREASFIGSQLEDADLASANLRHADLRKALIATRIIRTNQGIQSIRSDASSSGWLKTALPSAPDREPIDSPKLRTFALVPEKDSR